ncbi:MAG: TRAP transporter small permease [Chloroflexota bacterium]|nr:TRAP transporter small permease [Chloroflexota bacterium]
MLASIEGNMTRVKAFFDRIIFWAAALAAAQLIFMMLSQSIDVFLRYFFNQPQAWAKEIPEKMLLYITFLAAAWVLKEEKHVTMDFVTSRLKGRASAILNIVTSVISALVCLLLVWYGATATWYHYVKGLFLPSVLGILDWPVLIVIPIGSLLLFIQLIFRINGFARGYKVAVAESGAELV